MWDMCSGVGCRSPRAGPLHGGRVPTRHARHGGHRLHHEGVHETCREDEGVRGKAELTR